MNEKKEYIERGAVMEKFGGLKIMRDEIDSIPAVDVEPVVRCQKCKSWENEKMFDGKCWCDNVLDRTEPTFFCAHGKER